MRSARKPWAPITWPAVSAARSTAGPSTRSLPDPMPENTTKARSTPRRAPSAASPTAEAETLLTGNHLVNQYGMDNLETGSMISWAMELYELGILTSKETDGLDLRFGNDEALLEMIKTHLPQKGLAGQRSGRRRNPRLRKHRQEFLRLPDPGEGDEQPSLR